MACIVSGIEERPRRARLDALSLTEDETREAAGALKLGYNRSDVEAWDFTPCTFRGTTVTFLLVIVSN